jgi:Cu/Ag efflux protein CusF
VSHWNLVKFASALLVAAPLLAQQRPAAPPAPAAAPAPAATPAPAQAAAPRAAAAGGSVTAVATVDAINQETREVTLRKQNGETVSMVVGPEARNLAQVKKGDRVTVKYEVGMLVGIGEPGQPVRVEDTQVSRAPAGARPGGSVRQTTAVTATVLEIDTAARTVLLQGPRQTVEVGVAPDIDLSKVKVGERVGVLYSESFALTVEPAPQ